MQTDKTPDTNSGLGAQAWLGEPAHHAPPSRAAGSHTKNKPQAERPSVGADLADLFEPGPAP